jgi:hypothetical protein
MRTIAVFVVILAAFTSLAAAIGATATALIVNPVNGTRGTELVVTVTPPDSTSFSTNEIFTVNLDSSDWDNANSQTTDITCKASNKTKIFDSPASLFYATTTFINATGQGHFGVTFTSQASFVHSEDFNLICRLNIPTATAAAFNANVWAGTSGDEVFDTNVLIPAIVATPPNKSVAAVTFTVRSSTPTTWSLYFGVHLHYALLQGTFPTHTMVNTVGFYNTEFAYNSTTPAHSTLTVTVRLTPTLDTTTANLVTALQASSQITSLTNLINSFNDINFLSFVSATDSSINGLCYDGIREQTGSHWETDIDCGGSDCNACDLQEQCDVNTDCWSGVCNKNTGRCANSASALTVSFAVIAALIAAALFGL